MIEIKGLEKINALVLELRRVSKKSLKTDVRAIVRKQSQIAASQMRLNIKNQIKADGNKASKRVLQRAVKFKEYSKKNKNLIKYRIFVSKGKIFALSPAKKPYYAIMYAYGHINKGWNAKGKNRTAPRNFIEKTRKQIEANNIDEKILTRVEKSLTKAIKKANNANK